MIIGARIPFCLLFAAALVPATAQTVTVTMLQSADSSKPAATQFNARVKTAATVGNVTVPAGSNAVVRLVQAGAGNWTLSLVSLTANGQAVPVSGNSPTLAGAAGLGNGLSSAQSTVTGILKGFGRKSNQNQNQTPSTGATAPAVSGARVYVPVGADVQFVVAGSVSAAPARRGVAAPPPAAAPPVPQPGIQPQPGAAAVAAPGSTAAAAPAAVPAATTATTVVYENIQYQLQSCQRQAPHIVCQIQITNLGSSDARLVGGSQTYYFDQAGNRQGIAARSIANCAGFSACELLPGIPTAGRFEFVDQDNRATSLVRLQVWENNKAVAQFNNVPIQ